MKFDSIYDGLIKGTEKLALVGLGYVGMPIAVEFAKHISVIGFDINEKRVNEYASGIDATNEVGEAIKNTTVEFTADPTRLKEAKFIVVAVPKSAVTAGRGKCSAAQAASTSRSRPTLSGSGTSTRRPVFVSGPTSMGRTPRMVSAAWSMAWVIWGTTLERMAPSHLFPSRMGRSRRVYSVVPKLRSVTTSPVNTT